MAKKSKKHKKVSKEKKSVKKSKKSSSLRSLDPKNEKEIAMDLAMKVHEKFDRMIKASVLFGSQVKNTASSDSDIDIVFIIDDASINWDLELIAWYREEMAKIVSAQEYGTEFHINTIKLTTWWHDLLHGDPVVLNILRYGEALIDSGGFFNPIKSLLVQGKIRSTPEAVYAALQRAPQHIARSKQTEMAAVEGVYWAMIDSAQAALMTAGKIPPSPEHIPAMLKTTFVDTKMLKMDAVNALKEIYSLHKTISHRQISDIKGVEIDKWQDTAEKFLTDMINIIDSLLEKSH